MKCNVFFFVVIVDCLDDVGGNNCFCLFFVGLFFFVLEIDRLVDLCFWLCYKIILCYVIFK